MINIKRNFSNSGSSRSSLIGKGIGKEEIGTCVAKKFGNPRSSSSAVENGLAHLFFNLIVAIDEK